MRKIGNLLALIGSFLKAPEAKTREARKDESGVSLDTGYNDAETYGVPSSRSAATEADRSAMTQNELLPAPTGKNQFYWKRLLVVATIAGILAMVLVYPFSLPGRHWSELFNLAHAPSFFAAYLLVAGLFDPSSIGFPKTWRRILPLGAVRLLILVIALTAFGASCEVLQGFVGRSPTASDIVANGCGLFAGLFWCFSRQRTERTGRIGFSLIAAGLLIVVSWSPILELHDCFRQHQDFPLLASFEGPRELHTWHVHQATIDQSTTWSTHGSASMRVKGSVGTEYPGVNFQWPIADWHGWTALEFDVFNPCDKQLRLRINVTDKLHAATDFAAADRYTTSAALPPRKHVCIRIELADIKKGPVTRPMDLSRIESMNLIIVRPETDFVFMIDNVRLTD